MHAADKKGRTAKTSIPTKIRQDLEEHQNMSLYKAILYSTKNLNFISVGTGEMPVIVSVASINFVRKGLVSA
jgi:hypothetical protein